MIDSPAPICFDEQRFLALSGTALDNYVRAIEDAGRPGIDARSVRRLMDRLDTVGFLTAFYALAWAADLQLAGVSDAAINLLERAGREGGGEVSILILLLKAHDFTADHLRRIEAMTLPECFGVVASEIARLRARLAAAPNP